MSSFSIQNVAAADRPYEWGHAAARGSGLLLWDFWNGPTASNRVAALEAQGRWRVGAGTAALPALSFVDDTDTGFYRIGANNVGLALGGAKVVDFGASQVDVPGLKVGEVVYPAALAAGDILYASAANTLSRLDKGSDSQYLCLSSGVPVWGSLQAGVDAGDLDGDGLEVDGAGDDAELRVALDGSSLARSSSGIKVSDGFIHGLTAATIVAADRIPFSDESTAGDLNRYTSFANFKTALNIPAAATPFDLHDAVGTSATIAGSDRILFSDEGTSGDPHRYTTFANFRTALALTAEASASQVTTGTASNVFLSPRRLLARTATATRVGLVELATQTEVNAGTDTDRAVTPATLGDRLSDFFTDTIQPNL